MVKSRAAYRALRKAEDKAMQQRDLALAEPRAMLAEAKKTAEKELDKALLDARKTAFRARGGTGKYTLEAELRQRRQALHETINSKELKVAETRRGCVGDTCITTHANGGKAVIKKQEPALNDREEAGLRVAHALGIADAPVFERTHPDTIVLEFVDGTIGADSNQREVLQSQAGHVMGFLDRLIGNEDRNPGNWIKSSVTGNPVPIDHGYSFDDDLFGSNPGAGGVTDSPFAREADPAFDQAQFNKWRTELHKLEGFFKHFEASTRSRQGFARSGSEWWQRMMWEFEHWALANEDAQSREIEAQQDILESVVEQMQDEQESSWSSPRFLISGED